MTLRVEGIHAHLESEGVALRVACVAPMRLDDESEAFACLARRDVAEAVGVLWDVTDAW